MSKDVAPSGSTIVRTVHLMVKRTLFGVIGITAVAATCFASTMPSSLRLVEQQDGTRVLVPKPVSARPVAATHARRTPAAKGLQPKSPDTKIVESKDRKAAQTAHALAGCKAFTPADEAPAVPGKSTARKSYNNSNEEKSLCNPGSPRSR
jgi:hypothetical protein